MEYLRKEFTLPCGAILKNRIAKSAMGEGLARKDEAPNEQHFRLYDLWAKGGAGLIITGNVMVDRKAVTGPGNVVVDDRRDFEMLMKWAKTKDDDGSHLWVQLNHPGRQAGKSKNQNVAPSAIPVNVTGSRMAFGIPRALEEGEIWKIVESFGNTALILKEAGFSGVQIHSAHGYLSSQFLSPLSNQRKDQWGGSLENRSRFVLEVYKSIRNKVGSDFPVGIKINSADFQRGGFTEEESMEVVNILSSLGIDLIEVSGGTYEEAAMMGSKKKSTMEREAYFIDYIEKVRKQTDKPLMLTGGFRTASVMNDAVKNNLLDIVGIARPFALIPDLVNQIFDETLKQLPSPSVKTGIKFIDNKGFLDLMWHGAQLKRLANNQEPNPKMTAWGILTRNALRRS